MQTKLRCLQVWQHATLSRSNFSFGTTLLPASEQLWFYTRHVAGMERTRLCVPESRLCMLPATACNQIMISQ
jgi:hypothetical protein